MKVCVTGAAGLVAQSFIPLLCNGSVFKETKITLSLLDINNEYVLKTLNGLKLELQDCNFETLDSVSIYTNPSEAFKDCDLIVFIGGFPRKQGMTRKDLLKMNAKIYQEQGVCLKFAKPDVKILVVANPCNTNAKVLLENIKKNNIDIKSKNITALSRLDQNRAESLFKEKFSNSVCNFFIWGNHSDNMFIDTLDKNIEKKINEEFIKKTTNRGAEIISVKGSSSSFSAANAIKDHLKDWYYGNSKIVSMSVVSNGEYGVQKDLIFSFPVRCFGNWEYEFVKEIQLNDERKQKIKINVDELNQEFEDI